MGISIETTLETSILIASEPPPEWDVNSTE